ncbi:MAG: hypothetical protein R3D67_22380 [Hyphomicrobiaceae bacterium]
MKQNEGGSSVEAASGLPDSSGLPVLPPAVAILEILLLIVAPALLDHLVPAFPSLNDGQPHFFWLPVLLLSMQYGPVSGLLAAGTAIIFSAFLGWPEQEIGENHFSYLLRIWLQPVLWLAAAIILGQFRLRQIERKEALRQEVLELRTQRQAIADHARNLRQRCELLERTLATRADPDARRLLTAMGRLQSTDAPLAAAAFHDAVRLGFGDCVVSLWVRDNDVLRLTDRQPEGAEARSGLADKGSMGAGEALHTAIVAQGRRLSVLVPGDERDLDGAGVAATPIMDLDGSVLGMLLLERASPAQLDATTTLRLGAVARMLVGRLRKT